MNDESPFRISSMLLTVACLVCSISTAVLLVPGSGQRAQSVDHSTSTGALQLNLAEFHANQPGSAPEKDQPLPPTRRTLVPVSSSIPLKKNIGSGVASTPQSESHSVGGVGSVQTASSNLIESTVIDRHAHQGTSPVGSVPQFYVPVTVHPVTVNIDNSGIIREISRVNERLDSLATEKSRFEKDVMARIEEVKITKPPAELTHELIPAANLEPVAGRFSEPEQEPVVVPPVEFHPEAPVQPTSEIEFEAEPKTDVSDVPSFELPSAESEAIESQSVPDFEFSTESLPVASPVPVTPEVASFIEFEAEPVAAKPVPAEPVAFEPDAQSDAEFEFEFEMVTTNATTDVETSTPQTAEIPVLPDLTAPGLQWEKRTTDPPFRSGVIAGRSIPRAAITNQAASKIQQVKQTVAAGKPPEPPSKPPCHDCLKAKEKSAYRIKAVTPPSPMQRIRSLFK